MVFAIKTKRPPFTPFLAEVFGVTVFFKLLSGHFTMCKVTDVRSCTKILLGLLIHVVFLIMVIICSINFLVVEIVVVVIEWQNIEFELTHIGWGTNGYDKISMHIYLENHSSLV